MKIPVKKTINIPDGEHVGVIVETHYRNRQYDYVDVVIEFPVENEKVRMKAGFPMLITERSALGILLWKCGARLIPGEEIDPDDYLIGKSVKFSTRTESNLKGDFANIDKDTIRPVNLREYTEDRIK